MSWYWLWMFNCFCDLLHWQFITTELRGRFGNDSGWTTFWGPELYISWKEIFCFPFVEWLLNHTVMTLLPYFLLCNPSSTITNWMLGLTVLSYKMEKGSGQVLDSWWMLCRSEFSSSAFLNLDLCLCVISASLFSSILFCCTICFAILRGRVPNFV